MVRYQPTSSLALCLVDIATALKGKNPLCNCFGFIADANPYSYASLNCCGSSVISVLWYSAAALKLPVVLSNLMAIVSTLNLGEEGLDSALEAGRSLFAVNLAKTEQAIVPNLFQFGMPEDGVIVISSLMPSPSILL